MIHSFVINQRLIIGNHNDVFTCVRTRASVCARFGGRMPWTRVRVRVCAHVRVYARVRGCVIVREHVFFTIHPLSGNYTYRIG